MPLKLFVFFVTFLTAAFLPGCSSDVANTGYLHDYSKLREGKYLQKYWSSPSLREQNKYEAIYVKAINIKLISDKKGVTITNCAAWLRDAIKKEAARLNAPLFFRRASEKTRGKKAVEMEVAVTEMAAGSSGPRMLTGDFRAGHAWVRVEGRILDAHSKEELAAFSDRKHSAGTSEHKNAKGDAGSFLVREMLRQSAVGIIKQIKESFNF